jgi:hypothetical protein
MCEIDLAFGARDYEQGRCPEWRAYTDQTFSPPEPPRRRIRLLKSSFGAAFALATGAFWFTMATDPPKTEAASSQLPMVEQITDRPGLDAHCKNFISTCPEDGRKWGGELSQGRT